MRFYAAHCRTSSFKLFVYFFGKINKLNFETFNMTIMEKP